MFRILALIGLMVRGVRLVPALIVATLLIAPIPALAGDPAFFNGYWRGVNPTRGSGMGPFLTIVSLTATPLPPRTVTDRQIRYSVSLRVQLNGDRPRVRIAPAPPTGRYPLPDRRPAVLPDRPIDILAATAEWFDDPEEGPFLRVSVRSDPYPDVPGEECSITIPIAEHGGPHLDAVYYQIVPQRSPCHGGLFEGLSGSRGYLVR